MKNPILRVFCIMRYSKYPFQDGRQTPSLKIIFYSLCLIENYKVRLLRRVLVCGNHSECSPK